MAEVKTGARVSLFGKEDAQGDGKIIGGPDKLGNWQVEWDVEIEGEKVTWEAIDESVVVE